MQGGKLPKDLARYSRGSPRLRCVMITYNDMPVIQKAVESVKDKVDEIIAVDGRFKDFPQMGGSDLSTDGTIEYLMSVKNCRLLLYPNLDEVQKRNKYLIGDLGDWYLHLDTDEELIGDIIIPEDADMLIMLLERRKPKQFMKRVRLFRHVEGLHYDKKHYWLMDGQGRTFALLDKPGKAYRGVYEGSRTMIYHNEERDHERMMLKRKYYRVLQARESRFREVE